MMRQKPSHFFCRICRKEAFVLTHGHHEFLRHFQGSKDFPRDQCLRLETPGWEVLDYEGSALSPVEAERQREKILRARLVVRDREYSFSEDASVDETGAVDANLGGWHRFPPSSKCCVWVEAMTWCTNFGRSLHSLLSVSTWMSRGHVARPWMMFMFAPYFLRSLCASNFLVVLVHHPEWDVSADFLSLLHSGKVARELQRGV